ncbi:28320_t:CDS:2, partial [Racocetra persica]
KLDIIQLQVHLPEQHITIYQDNNRHTLIIKISQYGRYITENIENESQDRG